MDDQICSVSMQYTDFKYTNTYSPIFTMVMCCIGFQSSSTCWSKIISYLAVVSLKKEEEGNRERERERETLSIQRCSHNYFVHILIAALLFLLFLYFSVYFLFFGGVASSTGHACVSCSFISKQSLSSPFIRPHALRFNVLTVACISSPPCSP